jgi:4,5-DOPA dioxygenase extradiol
MKETMPALFLGHGNPMNALEDNDWTRAWTALGASMPRPRAVLAISAHWYVAGTHVTAMDAPRTIHDFSGFPRALFEYEYPAPGDPVLAKRIERLLAPDPVGLDRRWGLDHGTWALLCHVFPDADVPVVQLSLDRSAPPRTHYELGRRLAPLRDDGVLILGSGNLVHNLRAYDWNRRAAGPADWAERFERRARELIVHGDHAALVDYEALGPDARLAIPTPEHYLPLLYLMAVHSSGEPLAFPVEGFDGGTVSMLGVRIG